MVWIIIGIFVAVIGSVYLIYTLVKYNLLDLFRHSPIYYLQRTKLAGGSIWIHSHSRIGRCYPNPRKNHSDGSTLMDEVG